MGRIRVGNSRNETVAPTRGQETRLRAGASAGGRFSFLLWRRVKEKRPEKKTQALYVPELYEQLSHRVSALIRAASGVVIGLTSAI